MLDDNLKVLGRRVQDLEIEISDKKESILILEREKSNLSDKLKNIYKEQQKIREQVEDELRFKIEEKDKEIRKMRELLQNNEHNQKNMLD